VFIRAPWVERAGDGVEVLAEIRPAANSTGRDVHAPVPVLCRSGPILVSSFHPELTADDRIHQIFLDMVGASSTC